MNQIQDDEIDLFELFQTLWNGKWIIIAFVAIAMFFGGVFLFYKKPVYESRLIYSVDTRPPFYVEGKITVDFQKKFYSVNVFEEWKQNNSSTPLVFEDFSMTRVVDGFVLSRDQDKLLAKLTSIKKDKFILVKSNQLPLLDEFFKYAKHISELLKNEYVFRAKEEISIIEARFKDLASSDSSIVNTLLSIDRYIVTSKKGASTIAIQPPTIPKKISPSFSLILAMSLILGGMVGVIFILVRNYIKKRKEQMTKA